MLKQLYSLVVLVLLSFSLFAQDASREMVDPAELGGPILATYPINWQYTPEAVLYDNGPYFNSPGGGPDSADGSILQTSLGLNVLGFAHQQSANFRVADDFVIPAGQTWTIQDAVFYAYQTGSTTTSTITGVNVRIWNGQPGVGTVIFGDTVTNRMSATTWSNCYRYSDTNPGTTRPLMRQTVTLGVTLGEGHYWIDWQSSGSLASGPWVPPITITGQASTGDALQYGSGAWNPIIDNGTAQTPQGLPFSLNGTMGTLQTKSLKIVQNNDQVKVFNTTAYTTGSYKISFMVYIPSGKAGYFNTLQTFAGNNSDWGMEVYFDANGTGRCFGGSTTAQTFSWTAGQWNMVEHVVNLTTDQSQFYFNGQLVKQWQWTLGANGSGGPNTLHAVDLFGATANDQMYVDNFKFEDVTLEAVIFYDDFEAYTAGQQLACQAPTVWTTWSNAPCGPEDGMVSTDYSYVPVELTSFAAKVNAAGQVELNWSTATELNNLGFQIERKVVDGEFLPIGYVKGNGTTTEVKEYSFTDRTVEIGKYIYRLKQMDYDGKFEYSPEIEVDVNPPLQFTLEQNYPNPFNPSTKIKFGLAENTNVKLAVYNLLGELVAILINNQLSAGFYEVEFNATSLPSGMYIYSIETPVFKEVKKMMLMK
ncbi:MAG: T9SS type A sorting domain-containing protein [Ignavibacterium album]|uniref:T9SS type A sorting domain-containing protein n=1 Tax=Ignavibacterium album TaxID=591197 RepID=UPI0026EEC7B4|nr:T9SS type A sorting domain-containing protein [Ignavibacterium album]MBI5661432.1 T9SS type A sorting domain-containing protein [Ignavibacterium album]